MTSTARAAKASTQHSRLRRRAQMLTEEVGRLETVGSRDLGSSEPDLHLVPKTASSPFNVELFLDKAVDLTKGWEKIAALVALITTNLSGNKSLGALLEIMAKDKALPTGGAAGAPGAQALGSFNITELLGMAENLLKTGQLPAGPQQQVPPPPQEFTNPLMDGEIIEASITETLPMPLESELQLEAPVQSTVSDEYSADFEDIRT